MLQTFERMQFIPRFSLLQIVFDFLCPPFKFTFTTPSDWLNRSSRFSTRVSVISTFSFKMDVLKTLGRAIQRSKCLQITLVVGLLVMIYIYYSLGSYPKITAIRDRGERNKNAKVESSDTDAGVLSVSHSINEIKEIDVMITFARAENNFNLQSKFRTTVKSMLRFSSVLVNLYILGDVGSEKIARSILEDVSKHGHKYKV